MDRSSSWKPNASISGSLATKILSSFELLDSLLDDEDLMWEDVSSLLRESSSKRTSSGEMGFSGGIEDVRVCMLFWE